jgi:hypothetical protein
LVKINLATAAIRGRLESCFEELEKLKGLIILTRQFLGFIRFIAVLNRIVRTIVVVRVITA